MRLSERTPGWFRWPRIVLGLVVLAAGVVTQFDVTVKQEVTRPKIVKVEVPPAKLVHKPGTIPEADCFALAKQKGKATQKQVLDTYGFPKGYGDDSGAYPLTEDSDRTCFLSFFGSGDTLSDVLVDLT